MTWCAERSEIWERPRVTNGVKTRRKDMREQKEPVWVRECKNTVGG